MGWIRGAMIESFLVALGATGLLLGFILIYLARRGRRIDDHPLCRKCGYDLTGRAEGSNRCAECGADLSRHRAIRVGNRTPRRPLFWAGLSITAIFLVLTSAFVWVHFSRIDLMQYKPVWMLRGDASSLLATQRTTAVKELTRRFAAGELTDAQIQAIISDALVIQANPSIPWREWESLMDKVIAANKVGDADWAQFVRQAVRPRLAVRPRVRAGDPMPITLEMVAVRLPGRNPMRHFGGGGIQLQPPFFDFRWLGATVSGQSVTGVPSKSGSYGAYVEPVTIDSPGLTGIQTSSLSPGVHRMRGRVRIFVPNKKPKNGNIDFEVGVETDVTILPSGTDPQQLLVTDPALRPVMQDGFGLITISRRDWVTQKHVVHIPAAARPAGLAHQAILRRSDGRELAIGSITLLSQRYSSTDFQIEPDGDLGAAVDVILRPDFELVKNTTRSDPIWGEEIIFRDIKITSPGNRQRGPFEDLLPER